MLIRAAFLALFSDNLIIENFDERVPIRLFSDESYGFFIPDQDLQG